MFPFHDNNPTFRTPIVTILLIAANIAAFLWWTRLPGIERERVVVQYGFVPARIAQLNNPNLPVKVDMEPPERADIPRIRNAPDHVFILKPKRDEIVRSLFSTMFLHGGWMHLIGNMWFLWLFGNNIEDRLGHFLFICFYAVGGLIATACHWAYDPASTTPVIGASGAVAAVLGAYAVTFPTARVKTLIFLIFFISVIELPAIVVLGIWFVSQLFDALGAIHLGIDGGVAWWAHVGGFVSGVVLMPLLSAGSPPPGTSWQEEARRAFS